MGIFSTIMDKIFHHPAAVPAGASAGAPPTAAASAPAAAAPAAQPVDVEAVLTKIAAGKGGASNCVSPAP